MKLNFPKALIAIAGAARKKAWKVCAYSSAREKYECGKLMTKEKADSEARILNRTAGYEMFRVYKASKKFKKR